jgi:osmotically inducible protein OsmC
MAARTANAMWEGTLKEGRGQMSVGSGAFEGAYSYTSRFGEGENGTNPEELIAAAHAGCFTMALSLILETQGNPVESIQTQARASMRNIDDLPTISKMTITTKGKVPGIDQAAFEKAAESAKESCIVSRALAGVPEMVVEAELLES